LVTFKLRSKERIVAVALYVAIALLVYNQRVGWDDDGGPNWLAFVLRSDLWFEIAVIIGISVIPRSALWLRGRFRPAKYVLLSTPIIFLLAFLLATLISKFWYGADPNLFGVFDFAKAFVALSVGFLIFNFARKSANFSSNVINLLIWAPAINVLTGALTLATPLDTYFLELNGSGRFEGLASNPNIVMTQNGIALGLLIPRILQSAGGWSRYRAGLMLYAILLVAVTVWTGVRAALFILPLVCLIAVWLRFRPSLQNLRMSVVRVFQFGLFFMGAWFIVSSIGLSAVLVGRLATEDGRLFLWIYYFNLLLEYPMGLGMAFETVADLSFDGLRLPPHNALLQAGMYGGVIGIVASIFMMGKIMQTIARLRQFVRPAVMSTDVQGVFLAWCSLVMTLMFAGLFFGDFNFAILSALLLSLSDRFYLKAKAKGDVVVHQNVLRA